MTAEQHREYTNTVAVSSGHNDRVRVTRGERAVPDTSAGKVIPRGLTFTSQPVPPPAPLLLSSAISPRNLTGCSAMFHKRPRRVRHAGSTLPVIPDARDPHAYRTSPAPFCQKFTDNDYTLITSCLFTCLAYLMPRSIPLPMEVIMIQVRD